MKTLPMRNSSLNAAAAFGAHAELARAAHRDAHRAGIAVTSSAGRGDGPERSPAAAPDPHARARRLRGMIHRGK